MTRRLGDPLRALLVLGILPNVVVSLAATLMHGSRALVDVDYLVIAALDRFVSRGLLATMLTLALLMDVAFTFAPAFNFGPTEVVAAVAQIRHFSGRTTGLASAFVVLVALIAFAIVRLRGRRDETVPRWSTPALAGTVAVVALALDVVNGSNALTWRARPALAADLTSSTFATRLLSPRDMPPTGRLDAATDGLRELLASGDSAAAPTKVVIVIVESMGSPRAARASEMFAPLMTDAIARRYDTRTGTVAFFGATSSGELRELCGSAMNHFIATVAALDCLPSQFSRRGYETVAIHGYNGVFLDRTIWWPRVGFQRMLFQPELQQGRRLPECGTLFHGVCDSSIVPLIREELGREPSRRQLIYWLTLTSHFPLFAAGSPESTACRTLGAVGQEPDICTLWSAVWPALEGIGRLAADTTLPSAWYVIVGDHGPPELMTDSTLFDQRRVPFIELRPRVR
jgi:hypothetical protein